jgi:hypothetical protein
MTLRVAAVTLVAFAGAAAPAAAATLAPLKACYASAGESTDKLEDVVVQGDGFAPMSTVDVLVDGVPVGVAPTGSIGEFERLVDAPYQRRGERPFTVEARDVAGTSVVAQSRVTNLTVTMRPRRSPPNRRVRFRGRGFTRPAPIFAHYLHSGKEQKTVRLARRSTAPCGTFDVKRRQIPVANARTGRWIMQVDQKRAFSPEPDPVWVRLPIDVVEVFADP